MDLALWITAVVLAALYLVGGLAKVVVPKEKIATFGAGGWVEDFSAGTVKTIGGLEALAAVGLVLPAALDIFPVLVPLAAIGLAIIMTGAVITRAQRREYMIMLGDLVYLALVVFIAWGRLGPESFLG